MSAEQLKQFRLDIDHNPADWLARLVYADLLEESNRHTEASGQRWQVENKKYALGMATSYDWWWRRTSPPNSAPSIKNFQLHGLLYDPMKRLTLRARPHEFNTFQGYIECRTRQGSEILLAEALKINNVVCVCNEVPIL